MVGIVSNKVAIVTGAGRGIGRAIALAMAQAGARVVVCDIGASLQGAGADAGPAQDVVSEIKTAGGEAIASTLSIAEPKNADEIVKVALTAFGRVDILVNNAGLARDMRITKMSEEDWDIVLDVILKGAFQCTKAVLPHMNDRKWGRVVNISSRAHLGNPGQANYSAAKAGIIGFTRAMALEAGRNNITVNAVAPGMIDTPFVRSHPQFEKIRENAIKTTPIPRIGEPEDVADAVAFLASERASYITGDVVHVTGGRY
jgi:3-oxoacyl-[acyl-carrier protein] reductase